MQFITPLRYPGGKGRLTQVVADIMESNDLIGGHYAEPYAGGASVALSLLMLEYASHIHINDLNPSIHAFWDAVLNETDRLCAMIKNKRVTMAEWRRQHDVQTDPDADSLDLAYSTFFLNRTNRSGIIFGGVIGGMNQKGPYKLVSRFNQTDFIQRMHKIHLFLISISPTPQEDPTLIILVLHNSHKQQALNL